MKIFVSYSRANTDFVTQMVADLRAICEDIDIWLDTLSILPGGSIISNIEKAIRISDYFLIVLSRKSVASTWVREELDAAIVKQIESEGTFIIPLLLEDCTIPPLLAAKRYINFTGSYNEGIQELTRFLNHEERAGAPIERRCVAALTDLKRTPEWAPRETREYSFLRESVVRFPGDNLVRVLIPRNDGSTQTAVIKADSPLQLLADDLSRELDVSPTQILLIHRETNEILKHQRTPFNCGLKDGDSLLIIYYKQCFHTYSLAAQIGKSAEAPFRLLVYPENDEALPVLRGILYTIERFILRNKGRYHRKKDLSGAEFHCERLRYGNLSDSQLISAKLNGADLRYADCSYTNFRGADLRHADLRDCCFAGANLMLITYDQSTQWGNADLSRSIGLTRPELRKVELAGAKITSLEIIVAPKSILVIIVGVILLMALGLAILYLSCWAALKIALSIIPTPASLVGRFGQWLIGIPVFLAVLTPLANAFGDLVCNLDIITFNVSRLTRKLFDGGGN